MLGIYGTVYNSADTVRQTIEDIKNKLKEDFVIVVTDNFSTDGTYEILKEYDFIDVIRAKSTRGLGRRIALKYLIKNYPEVDFIFYIDFDTIYPDYLQNMINGIKKRYEYGEFYGGFASYETYKDSIKKVLWPDMNLGEDHLWTISLIRKGFKLYRMCFPIGFNQIRKKREKKYGKGFKYIKRMTNNIIKDWLIFLNFNIFIKTGDPLNFRYLEGNYYNLFPEDIGLDKNLLFLLFKSYGHIYEKIKKTLEEHEGPYRFIYLKPKSKLGEYIIIYRNRNKILNKALGYFIKYFKE